MTARLTRRTVLKTAAIATLAKLSGGCAEPGLGVGGPPTRLLAAPDPWPVGRDDSVFAIWNAVQLPALPTEGALVRFGEKRTISAPGRLRLTCAVDLSVAGQLTVMLAKSRTHLADIDVRSPYLMQPFEVILPAPAADAARREGVLLAIDPTLAGFAVFAPAPGVANPPPAFLPQLLVGGGRDADLELRDRMSSIDSLQPFGWMEGCVLEGQNDLFAATGLKVFQAAAASTHLGLYVTPGGLSIPRQFSSIEQTLPIAAIVRLWPDHPLVDQAIAFWTAQTDSEGVVRDQGVTAAIGAYSVAYPMAVVAAVRRAPALAQLALKQLSLRQRRLARDGNFYARAREVQGALPKLEGRNSALNIGWWMLGLARTLKEIPPVNRSAEVGAELARMAAWVRQRQRTDGLWDCYIGEPATGAESAGSAAIATALAFAAKAGLLSPQDIGVARKAYAGLKNWLTPDGILGGVAQRDTGDATLNRSGYRALAPYASGLMAQLTAALQPGAGRE